jgi:outer membrane protein
VIVTPQPWSSSLGINASVSVFDGGQRFFDIAQANAGKRAAAAGGITAQWEAALAAKQAFFDVLAAREIGVAAEAQLEQAEQQRVTAIARTQAKAATRSDSLRAEIQVRSAQLAVLQASTSRASADAALGRAVGSLEPVTAAESDTLEMTGLALDESQLNALVEDAPAVRTAKADLDAAHAVKNGTWSLYLPSVTASWSRSGSGADTAPNWTNGLEYLSSLRLGLNFPVFDQFQREERRTQADVAVDNAEATLRDARLAARQSLVDGLGGYREAAERVASTNASVEASVEDLRVQQQRYEVGGSTLLDVLASQTQLDQARRDLIRARYDQRVAKAQLEALVGRNL